MTQLTETITEAINKNLPQQIGQELQKELAELAVLRIKCEKQADVIAANRLELAACDRRVALITLDLEKHAAIDAREVAVMAREQKQDLNQFMVAQANERRAEMLGLVGLVFRSPVYQTHVAGKVPVTTEGIAPGGLNQYGTPGMVHQADVALTTTNTQF